MKLSNIVWSGILLLIIVVDIIFMAIQGYHSTLSYFVYSHKKIFAVPFYFTAVLGHFFPMIKAITNKRWKYYLLSGAGIITIILSFYISNFYIIIPLILGYIVGNLFWSQKQ